MESTYDQRDYATTQEYGAKQEQVPVLEDLNREVDRLAKLVEYASTRLANVLAPEYDSVEKARSEVPRPLTSPIRETHLRLSSQIDRLSALVDRVEV